MTFKGLQMLVGMDRPQQHGSAQQFLKMLLISQNFTTQVAEDNLVYLASFKYTVVSPQEATSVIMKNYT
jgi:hypothetical protein